MHEWALADSIIATALEVAKKERLRTVTDVVVQVGELQQIERGVFRFALKECAAAHPRKFPKVVFRLRTEKSLLRCQSCSYEWSFDQMRKALTGEEFELIHFIPEVVLVHARCPRCRSPDFAIRKGRGVVLASLKGTR